MLTVQRHHLLLGVLFICYFLTTLNRRAFQHAIPFISSESWITKTDIGLILSCHTSGYTVSKFISGIAVDYIDSRLMLVLCLLLSAFITEAFAFSRLVWLSCFLSFIGGCIQGMAWPSVGKLIRIQMPPQIFGFAWVLISCSMNLSSMVGPVMTTFIAQMSHWTFSHTLVAVVSFVAAIGAFFILLSDTFAQPPGSESDENSSAAGDRPLTLWTIATNPVIMALSFGYFAISILRYAAVDWIPLYLIKDRGMSEVYASSFVSTLEIGGIVGSFLGIRVSDAYMRKKRRCLNPRIPCIVVLTMIACNAAYLVAKHADPNQKLLLSFSAFFLGLSIYGPISLYGVAAIESAPNNVSGSCHTMVALAANIGAILSGYPIGAASNFFGWTLTFYIVIMLISISGIILVLARNATPLKPSLKIE